MPARHVLCQGAGRVPTRRVPATAQGLGYGAGPEGPRHPKALWLRGWPILVFWKGRRCSATCRLLGPEALTPDIRPRLRLGAKPRGHSPALPPLGISNSRKGRPLQKSSSPHSYYFKQMFLVKVLKLRRIYVCISRQREACRKPVCHENAAIYRPLLYYLEKE